MSKESEQRVINQAEETIEEASNRSFNRNYERFQKELHGKGCGCRNCKREAVSEYQKDVDFITKGGEPVRWYVDDDGNICWYMDNDKLNNIGK